MGKSKRKPKGKSRSKSKPTGQPPARATIVGMGILGDPSGERVVLADGREDDDKARRRALAAKGSAVLPLGPENAGDGATPDGEAEPE